MFPFCGCVAPDSDNESHPLASLVHGRETGITQDVSDDVHLRRHRTRHGGTVPAPGPGSRRLAGHSTVGTGDPGPDCSLGYWFICQRQKIGHECGHESSVRHETIANRPAAPGGGRRTIIDIALARRRPGGDTTQLQPMLQPTPRPERAEGDEEAEAGAACGAVPRACAARGLAAPECRRGCGGGGARSHALALVARPNIERHWAELWLDSRSPTWF